MTIPKRDKRKRRVEKSLAYPPSNKMVEYPEVQKAIHYPRTCPFCGQGSYSTICKCGRLTRIKIITK